MPWICPGTRRRYGRICRGGEERIDGSLRRLSTEIFSITFFAIGECAELMDFKKALFAAGDLLHSDEVVVANHLHRHSSGIRLTRVKSMSAVALTYPWAITAHAPMVR
jgi:hypothetical protein